MIRLTVNTKTHILDLAPETPLLWALRDHLGLTGTKYGCGRGSCGACTVHLDGDPVRSCVVPLAKAEGSSVVTIEGLGGSRGVHPVQRAWVLEDVSQCGYCQPGQIMTAAALLRRNPSPSDAEIAGAMDGVLCRCATYRRIREAIRLAGELLRTGRTPELPVGPSLGAGFVAAPEAGDPRGWDLNPWVRILGDGTAVVRVDKSEMGQGVLTTLAAAVAEELEIPWERVRIEPAPAGTAYTDPALGEQLTGGSTSTRFSLDRMRRAGARGREALVAAAARAWGVEPGTCRALDGRVFHSPSGRRKDYPELARVAAELRPPEPALKDSKAWRLLGSALPRADALPKATGEAIFGLDVRPPGRKVAAVARCPIFGGRVEDHDPARALAVPGVCAVVPAPSGVAVIAESTWAALAGREALDVRWVRAPAQPKGLDDRAVQRELSEALARPGVVADARGGDTGAVRTFRARRGSVVEAEYALPYLCHAPLEPMNATARVGGGECEVWAPTQAQTGARRAAAQAAGVPEAAVCLHTPFLGGGFGRRLESDYVAEATEVAKAARTTVQVVWTREDDLGHDAYRPPALHRLRATLEGNGRPAAWLHRIATPSLRELPDGSAEVDPSAVEGAVGLPYDVPRLRVEWCPAEIPVPLGYWRSVGHSHTAFAVECFVDELAAAAGTDPLEFRLRLLARAPRHRAVLERAAAEAGWRTPGRALGIAVHESFGSVVAQVAEVEVAGAGFRVVRLVCAADCGPVANPAGAAAQLEGGTLFGLSAALREAASLRDGAVAEPTFGAYRLLTFNESPPVAVHLVQVARAPGGAGEPGVPPVAPAVANALFAATGRRVRRLPLVPSQTRQRGRR